MAILRIGNDNSSVNLLDNVNYALELGKDQFGYQGKGTETYVFQVHVLGATRTAVQANFNELIRVLDLAVAWHRDKYTLDDDAIFLYRENDGEGSGDGVQALVYSYGYKMISSLSRSALQLRTERILVNLSITVGPWESVERESVSGVDTVSIHGGYNICDTAVTHAPKRNGRVRVQFTGSNSLVSKVWFGMRPGYTSSTKYNPVWKLEDGTAGLDSYPASGTGSVGTNIIRTTFSGTPGMAVRATISLEDILPSPTTDDIAPYIGEYYALVRCKVDNPSDDIFLKLGVGYDSNHIAYGETVRITGQTDWTYVPLGLVSMPPTSTRGNNSAWRAYYALYCKLYVAAERNAGTGNLEMDVLMMPPHEHFVALDLHAGIGTSTMVKTLADGKIEASTLSGNLTAPVITDANDFFFPYDYRRDGNFVQYVVVCQDNSVTTSEQIAVEVSTNAGQVFYGD